MCLESQGRLATWPFASPEQATVGGSMRRVSLTSLPSLPSLTSLASLTSLTSLTLPNFCWSDHWYSSPRAANVEKICIIVYLIFPLFAHLSSEVRRFSRNSWESGDDVDLDSVAYGFMASQVRGCEWSRSKFSMALLCSISHEALFTGLEVGVFDQAQTAVLC